MNKTTLTLISPEASLEASLKASLKASLEKELGILKWLLYKGKAQLSYSGRFALFTEQRYWGDVLKCEATTSSCTCQRARNGFVCKHIQYLKEGLDDDIEF